MDDDGIMNTAQAHGGSHGDSDLFSSALSFLKNRNDDDDDVDEDQMKQSHQQLYQQGGSGNHGSQSLGAGAALQALKMFSGGQGQSSMGGGGGGGGQSQMIGLAMSEASKLFDQQSSQGNVAQGTDKQSVVNSAAKMAMK